MTVALPLLDTDILVYAFTDDERAKKAQDLLAVPFVISIQALNEFANVAHRKLGMDWTEIGSAISDISALASEILPIGAQTNLIALDLVRRFRLSVFDALMVSVAVQAKCETCLSEDMQHGLKIDGRLTILNPFLAPPP